MINQNRLHLFTLHKVRKVTTTKNQLNCTDGVQDYKGMDILVLSTEFYIWPGL